jgi:hypothetical protein
VVFDYLIDYLPTSPFSNSEHGRKKLDSPPLNSASWNFGEVERGFHGIYKRKKSENHFGLSKSIQL